MSKAKRVFIGRDTYTATVLHVLSRSTDCSSCKTRHRIGRSSWSREASAGGKKVVEFIIGFFNRDTWTGKK